MKVETYELEDHQARLVVEIEADKLETAKHRAANALAKKVRIPGFRPGKAPYAMIVRHLGEGEIIEHAIELLVDDYYPQVIREAGIKPYGPGSLEQVKSLDPLTLEFIVPLAAQVELGNYRSIRIPYESRQITNEEVERVLSLVRSQNALIEPVDRPAQAGDLVQLRVSANKIGGSDEDRVLMSERQLSLVIGQEDEELLPPAPFPGFTEHLIGISAGQTITIRHQFAEDSAIETLRGVEAEFTVTIEQVNSRTLPELNDELAQSMGEFSTLEELRAAIQSDLQRQAEREYNEEYDDKVLDQLVEISTVVYPPQMLESEIEDVIRQLERRLEQQGLDLELYLKTRGINREQLVEETKPIAEARLKRALVLFEVGEKENIQVNQEELQDETIRTMGFFSRILPPKDFQRFIRKDKASSIVGNIMMDMMIEKTRERLRNYARGIATEVGAETKPTAEANEKAESPAEAVPGDQNAV